MLSRGRNHQHHPTLSFIAATSPIAEEGEGAPRRNQWASVIETSQPVLSSYFDPPFLVSSSCSAQDIEARRSMSEGLGRRMGPKRLDTHTALGSAAEEDHEPVSPPGMKEEQAYSSAEEKMQMEAHTVLPSLRISG